MKLQKEGHSGRKICLCFKQSSWKSYSFSGATLIPGGKMCKHGLLCFTLNFELHQYVMPGVKFVNKTCASLGTGVAFRSESTC
jgi:hypothetical protein